MRIIGYEFKEGARFQAGALQDAKAVGAHLEMLRKQFRGELTPDDVLKDAKHNNSPLHSFFEWDDSKAAEQHRLSQARGLIRAVVAIYRDEERTARKVTAFVHINEPGAPHYRSTEHAMSAAKTREMVLRQAWKEFQSWRKRYEQLDELADLFKKADEVRLAIGTEH